MEQVRNTKVIVIIETNKGTYKEEFENIIQAKRYWNDYFDSF